MNLVIANPLGITAQIPPVQQCLWYPESAAHPQPWCPPGRCQGLWGCSPQGSCLPWRTASSRSYLQQQEKIFLFKIRADFPTAPSPTTTIFTVFLCWSICQSKCHPTIIVVNTNINSNTGALEVKCIISPVAHVIRNLLIILSSSWTSMKAGGSEINRDVFNLIELTIRKF